MTSPTNLLLQIHKRPFSHLFLMAVLLFLLAWWAFEPLIFMNSDVGLRFIQIETLIAQNWRTFAVPYATHIDPNFAYVPYYYAYSLLDGRIFFNISPFFPFVTSFLYAGLGTLGLTIIPVVGTLLTAWGIYQLAMLLQLRSVFLAMWTAVIATPLLFYSSQLWDHTIGTGFAILGIALAVKGVRHHNWRSCGFGGLFLGLSLGQRPELYLFVGVLGIVWLLHFGRERLLTLSLLSGGLTGIVPLWIMQTIWFGHPLGMALATNLLGYGRPSAYPLVLDGYPRAFVMGQFLFHIEARDPLTFSAALAVLIGIILFFFGFRLPRYQKRAVFWGAAGMTAVGFLLWAIVARDNLVTGFISTFPLIGISLAFIERKEEDAEPYRLYRFLFFTTLAYLAGMVIFWPAFGARLWGSRYLLTAYPLMILLAFYTWETYQSRLSTDLRPIIRTAFGLLLFLSIGLQMMSLRLNYRAIDQLEAERNLITAQPVDAVLTNHPFWPALMGSQTDKLFFYTATTADVERILPQLNAHNVDHVAVISLASEPLIVPERLDNVIISPVGGIVYQLEAIEGN